jgi:hypothetical protein
MEISVPLPMSVRACKITALNRPSKTPVSTTSWGLQSLTAMYKKSRGVCQTGSRFRVRSIFSSISLKNRWFRKSSVRQASTKSRVTLGNRTLIASMSDNAGGAVNTLKTISGREANTFRAGRVLALKLPKSHCILLILIGLVCPPAFLFSKVADVPHSFVKRSPLVRTKHQSMSCRNHAIGFVLFCDYSR